jgi:hypothetical protein
VITYWPRWQVVALTLTRPTRLVATVIHCRTFLSVTSISILFALLGHDCASLLGLAVLPLSSSIIRCSLPDELVSFPSSWHCLTTNPSDYSRRLSPQRPDRFDRPETRDPCHVQLTDVCTHIFPGATKSRRVFNNNQAFDTLHVVASHVSLDTRASSCRSTSELGLQNPTQGEGIYT